MVEAGRPSWRLSSVIEPLQVYWFLLKAGGAGSFGVGEVQREVGFKSPSVALHHLEKLRELGLLSKTPTGEYMVTREVKVAS